MAEPTYTVRVDCRRCGETTTMAGVKPTPIVGGDLVNIAVHCDHCGAAGGYALERRRLIGQPDYIANVDMAHGWSAARIAVAAETTFGTASPIGEPSAKAIDLTAVAGMSDGSPPPTPADEWSKPVKGAYGWSVDSAHRGPDGATKVGLFADGELVIRNDDGSHSAPRDVVLRLLAAEASDRIGWVWEQSVETKGAGNMVMLADAFTAFDHTGGVVAHWEKERCENEIGFWVRDAEDRHLYDPDELLACLHGRFLLADALREAGQ